MDKEFGFQISNLPPELLLGHTKPQKEMTPADSRSRRFLSIRSAPAPGGGLRYLAIANDGTAWKMLLPDGHWQQIPDLPDRED